MIDNLLSLIEMTSFLNMLAVVAVLTATCIGIAFFLKRGDGVVGGIYIIALLAIMIYNWERLPAWLAFETWWANLLLIPVNVLCIWFLMIYASAIGGSPGHYEYNPGTYSAKFRKQQRGIGNCIGGLALLPVASLAVALWRLWNAAFGAHS